MNNFSGLIDFHCHLDLFPDFEKIIDSANRSKIYTLTVTTTPKAWPRNHEITKDTKYIRAALGLHPQLAGEREDEIKLFEKYFDEAKYIGEVGLDASSQFYSSFAAQQRVFKRILQMCNEQGDKIITVHSVRSARKVLDLIESNLIDYKGGVVLHWFTGSLSDAKRAINLGCYFSVNESMFKSSSGRKLIESIPIERILTETDAPFIKGANGIPLTPRDVASVIPLLGLTHNLTPNQAKKRLLENLKKIIS